MIDECPTDESVKSVLSDLCFEESWHNYLESVLRIHVYWRGQGVRNGASFTTDYESWRLLLKGARPTVKSVVNGFRVYAPIQGGFPHDATIMA